MVINVDQGSRKATWSVLPPEREGAHEWFWMQGQGVEDVVVFKCFDSVEREGFARRAAHCAFVDEEGGDEGARESLEVRALVVWD